MRIKEVLVSPLRIPLKKPFVTSRATQTFANIVIVRIRDNEGTEGFGEADPRPHITGETLESTTYALRNYLAPAFKGIEFEHVAQVHNVMDRILELNPSAKSAVDMAIYDLIGKSRGLPVYELIGGKIKNELRLNAWCGITDPEHAVKVLNEKVREGYNYAAKIKVGMGLTKDVELVRRIRKAIPNSMDLIIDANQAWDVPTTLTIMKTLADLSVTAVEQPVHWKDVDGMIELTRRLPMAVMADESVWSYQDARHIIDLKAASMINIKLIKAGGIYPSAKVAALAQVARLSCMIGGTVETSISAAAEAHFATATPNIKYLDSTIPEENLVEDVADGLEFRKGRVTLSGEAGLGLKLRESAIKKYEASFDRT